VEPAEAFPSVRLTWADGGYAGKLVTWAKARLKPKLTLESSGGPTACTPSRYCRAAGSSSGPCAWITRCRRTVRGYERLPAHHESVVHWAMTMTRRLAAGGQRSSRADR